MIPERVTLPDGADAAIEWFEPASAPARGLIGFLPALGTNADYYRPLADVWASRGYRVACVECRSGKRGAALGGGRRNFGYHLLLDQDLATIVPHLRARFPAGPFLLGGHSLGGQFALLYASRHPQQVDGVVIVAGGSNYYGSVAPRLQSWRWFQLRLARLITRVLGFFPGDRLGFGGRQPRDLMLDWTHEALTGTYRVLGGDIDYEGALAELDLPVLFVSVRGDKLVPRSSADYLARKLEHAKVAVVEVADASTPPHHFRWVKNPEAIVSLVEQWIDAEYR